MVDMNEECRKIAEDTIEILKGLEGDEAAQREYFDDILDIDYIVNGFNRSYRGVIIAVTLGGPGVYVDTYARQVKVCWGTARHAEELPKDVTDMIDDWFNDLWVCGF